jgi:hypothetical protein
LTHLSGRSSVLSRPRSPAANTRVTKVPWAPGANRASFPSAHVSNGELGAVTRSFSARCNTRPNHSRFVVAGTACRRTNRTRNSHPALAASGDRTPGSQRSTDTRSRAWSPP